MERRKFLQNTCPTVTFAFFGLSFVQACSKSDDEAQIIVLTLTAIQVILTVMILNPVMV